MKSVPVFLLLLSALNLGAQPFSSTFEMRYFTKDKKADGETDFKGETEWLNTDQRVAFLEKYADYASRFFSNRNFNNEIVTDSEIKDLISRIKPQPLTGIRTTMVLDEWKSYGYKSGQDSLKKKEIESWKKFQRTSVVDGRLLLNDSKLTRQIDTLNWRFKFECKIQILNRNIFSLKFSDDEKQVLSFEIQDGKLIYGSGDDFRIQQ